MTTNQKSSNTRVIDESLQKVAKGTGIVLIGTLLATSFGFISRLLIARQWTQSDFGIFSLALSILSIFAVISVLGLNQGVIRSISYTRGKKEWKKIPEFISVSILISITTSIISGVILFFLSDVIAEHLFHEPALILPLRIFSIALPFFMLIDMIVAIYRGFDEVKPTVYFQQILITLLFPVLLIAVLIFDLPFINVFYMYVISLVITCISLLIYVIIRIPSLKSYFAKTIPKPTAKELLIFSFPLLVTAMLQMIIYSTDTLMLGGLLLIYMPVIAGLYAKNLIDEMRRSFSILTKWICFATTPLFLIFFLFTEPIVELLFGSSYIPASTVLRIISLGFIINNFLGPNGSTLIAMGKSKFIMFATLASAGINVGLNCILIPSYGIEGAAIASAATLVSINLIRSWKLYSLNRMQPISKNLMKPTILSAIFISVIYLIIHNFLTFKIWMIPIFFITYYIIFGLAIQITRSLDQEDLMLLQAIEQKTGKKFNRIRKLIVKFL
jgi:O-antigen/teichoic acid export membrane protein